MNLSRRELLTSGTALAMAIALGGVEAEDEAPSSPLYSDVDAAARSALLSGACPGISVRICSREGLVLSKQYGLANLETGTPVSEESIFRVGSLTKQFTAALILKLAAQGKLRIDDPVARYLPFFDSRPAFSLRELLHHTAGLHSEEDGATAPMPQAEQPSQTDLAMQIIAQKKVFDFEPGTAWLYSNANYIVLGAVIESVTQMSLSRAGRELIFQPLALTRTAFDTAASVVEGRADGYAPIEGKAGSFSHAAYIEVSEAGGAGAMRSSAPDLCRWHEALFKGELFDAHYVDAMLAPGRLRDGRLSGSNRFRPEDQAYGEVQYAMGLLVSGPESKHRSAMHYGFINGFASLLETFVDSGITLVVLCNGDIGPDLPFRAIRRAVSRYLLP
jgi:D-alanyl-D-alanine carboxypeptidase